jgi:hypothetical protein
MSPLFWSAILTASSAVMAAKEDEGARDDRAAKAARVTRTAGRIGVRSP